MVLLDRNTNHTPPQSPRSLSSIARRDRAAFGLDRPSILVRRARLHGRHGRERSVRTTLRAKREKVSIRSIEDNSWKKKKRLAETLTRPSQSMSP